MVVQPYMGSGLMLDEGGGLFITDRSKPQQEQEKEKKLPWIYVNFSPNGFTLVPFIGENTKSKHPFIH